MSVIAPVDSSKTTLTDGSPVTPDHRDIQADGMQKGYVVLSAEERAKGFIRPVRQSYRHVGIRPKYPLRDLPPKELDMYTAEGYVKYEMYPESHPFQPVVRGKYWTEAQLRSGCGAVTTMGLALAETYARDPVFYGSTFCSVCRKHFPVGINGEFVWDGTDEKVGT